MDYMPVKPLSDIEILAKDIGFLALMLLSTIQVYCNKNTEALEKEVEELKNIIKRYKDIR